MKYRSRGFTMIEMLFVIMIGSVLMGIAIQSFGTIRDQLAIRSARTYYETLHQRAIARAVELGETVVLITYTSSDQVLWATPDEWYVHDLFNFRTEFNVDLQTTHTSSTFYFCMTPQGYADMNCGAAQFELNLISNVQNAFDVSFVLGGNSEAITMLPLGQIVR